MLGLQELLILVLLIGVLGGTRLWPVLIKCLRELRGEHVDRRTYPGTELEVCCKMLGISPSASWREIEAAYHRKAKVHHPDRGGDEDAMRALNDAYALLKQRHKT